MKVGLTLRAFKTATVICALFTQIALAQDKAPADQTKHVAELIEKMARDDFAGLDASRQLTQIGQQAVEPLIQATKHSIPRVRYWAIAALSGIGDERAVPPIKECLKDTDSTVRAVAVWHLGRWFDRKDVQEAVLQMLDEKDKFVRGWVIRLVTEKRFTDALPKVMPLLGSEDEEVRYDALHAVVSLKGQDALDLLNKTIKEDKSPLVRECALRTCTVIQPPTPRTAEVLIEGLSDSDEGVRKAAAELLRKGFGESFGFRFDGTPGSREKALWQWRTWYRLNKDKLRWDEKKRIFVVEGEAKKPPRQGAAP